MHNTNILFLKVEMAKDKNKWQISSQAKQGCFGNSRFSESLYD